jgi:hypothetical protein
MYTVAEIKMISLCRRIIGNRTHVYTNFFDHKDLGNHLLQFCPKVVKHFIFSLVHKIYLTPLGRGSRAV